MSRRLPKLVGLLAALAFAPSSARAEPAVGGQLADAQPTEVPPTLLEQVQLRYPDEAAAEGLHGDVTVRVSVDEVGAVTAVEVVSGPEVFVDAATEAARSLRFAPASSDGAPVPSVAVVFFHFAPPAPVVDEGIEEVFVHSDSPEDHDIHSRVTLGEAELARAGAQDLGETVSQVAGVTMARGTADQTKPIIRGQQERRLLLLSDGIRHEGQKWGADHAPEIDPFSAGRIDVIKGAAGVRYGPDAIGGVILVQPAPLRTDPGADGEALTLVGSNGRRGYAALRLDAVPVGVEGLSSRVEGNFSRSAALSAPDYVLGNTGSEVWNLGASLQYQREDRQVKLTYHRYDLRAGVFWGVQNGTPDAFAAQLEADRPVTADLWDTTYTIDRPYQAVSHDVVALHATSRLGTFGTVKGVYAFQLNHRREYEQVRDAVLGPQYDFVLRTHSLDLAALHDGLSVGAASLEGGFGAAGSFQENVYSGLSLLPNFRSFGAGVYGFERAVWRTSEVEVGARYDHLDRSVYLSENDYELRQRKGALDDQTCDFDGDVATCPTAYDTASVSVGGMWHAVPEHLDLKLDLSSANRFPNVDELYLVGSSPTFPVYGVGAPDLGVETTWGASPTVGLRVPWLEAEVSPYLNVVDDYIYFAPAVSPSGEPSFDVTVRGAFPRWTFSPVDAVFYGVDGSLSFGPEAIVGLRLQGSLVRAVDAATGDFLVGIPADRAQAALTLRPGPLGGLRDAWFEVSTEVVAEQTRVDPAADFAPPPDGYALLDAAFGADLPLRDATLRLGLEARNLTNAAYRDYTSLLRYYADSPGRDVLARVGLDF